MPSRIAASSRTFVLRWSAACAVATTFLIGAAACPRLPPHETIMSVLSAMTMVGPGLVLSLVQWPLLRSRVRAASQWAVAGGLGYLLGLIGGLQLYFATASHLVELPGLAGADCINCSAWSATGTLVVFGIVAASASLGTAALQSGLLARRIGWRALWWLLPAGLAGTPPMLIIIESDFSYMWGRWYPFPLAGCWPMFEGLPEALLLPGSGAVYGLVTALVLMRLLPAAKSALPPAGGDLPPMAAGPTR